MAFNWQVNRPNIVYFLGNYSRFPSLIYALSMVKKAAETTFFFSLIELILQPWHSIHALTYCLSKAQQRRLYPPQKYIPRGIANIGPHVRGALALTPCDSLGKGGARKAGRVF